MDFEQIALIKELTQGKELTKQLETHLSPSSSKEAQEFLLQRIVCSYEKALSMLGANAVLMGQLNPAGVNPQLCSPCSVANNSPRSGHKEVSKKRKALPRWTRQVRVDSGTAVVSPVDDGYSWRKYGQKEILGASFPRAYFRCTHRRSQGCSATKQVQKSDADPSVYEVIYRGQHTCVHAAAAAASEPFKSEVSIENYPTPQMEEKALTPEETPVEQLVLEAGPRVKTENLTPEEIFPSFSFRSLPEHSDNVGNGIFGEAVMDSNYMGGFSPAFVSPATSDSNYFSVSPCGMNGLVAAHSVQTPESDPTEIVSAPASVANSPIGNFDFSFDDVDFNDFQIDNFELFA